MKAKSYIFIVLVSCLQGIAAQEDLSPGFRMMEDGRFGQAQEFFADQLTRHPDHKTAQICYFRALGLSDSPSQALNGFKSLMEEYPADIEIHLNLAEAYLWDGQPSAASLEYQRIISADSSSAIAWMGLAHSQANSGLYQLALQSITHSLKLDHYAQAAESQKSIRLALANQLREAEQFDEAEKHIHDVLKADKDHTAAIMSMVDLQLMMDHPRKAQKYLERLATREVQHAHYYLTTSSYISRLLGQKSPALHFAEQSLEQATTSSQRIKSQLLIAESTALLGDFDDAFSLLKQINGMSKDSLRLISARLSSWNREFHEATRQLDSIRGLPSKTVLAARSQLFAAQGRTVSSLYTLDQIGDPQNMSIDQKRFREVLNWNNANYASLTGTKTIDGSGNSHQIMALHYSQKTKESTIMSLDLHRDEVLNGADISGVQNTISLRINKQHSPSLSWGLGLGLIQNRVDITRARLQYEGRVNWQASRKHGIELQAANAVQNYTTELLGSQLLENSISLSHHFSPSSGPSMYSQLRWTSLSDGNKRSSAFLSPHIILSQRPIAKMGLNYLYMAHKSSNSEIYFSPRSFQSLEIFASIDNSHRLQDKFHYTVGLASGFQLISEQSMQHIWRAEIELGYRVSQGGKLAVKIMHNTSAQSTIAGFQFSSAQIKFTQRFIKIEVQN